MSINNQDDPTEALRRQLTDEINSKRAEREPLEKKYGKVWDTQELQQDFQVQGFAAPFCIVVRKSDNVKGALTFQHGPRYYFDFVPTEK